MLKGTNILYGTGLYLAAIWALYGQKKITFKDQKEIDQLANIVLRKGIKDKKGFKAARERRFGEFTSSKRFEGQDVKDWKEFREAYEKKQWVR